MCAKVLDWLVLVCYTVTAEEATKKMETETEMTKVYRLFIDDDSVYRAESEEKLNDFLEGYSEDAEGLVVEDWPEYKELVALGSDGFMDDEKVYELTSKIEKMAAETVDGWMATGQTSQGGM